MRKTVLANIYDTLRHLFTFMAIYDKILKVQIFMAFYDFMKQREA